MYCLEIGPGKCNKRNNRDVWLNSYLKSWFWQAVKKAIKAAQDGTPEPSFFSGNTDFADVEKIRRLSQSQPAVQPAAHGTASDPSRSDTEISCSFCAG